MVIGRRYILALGAVIGLALLWQAIAVGSHLLEQRREARTADAVAALNAMEPPARFQKSACAADGHACMRGSRLPQESIEQVASMLASDQTPTSTRCFEGAVPAPPDCMVLAELRGVTVAGFLTARLMPEPPVRFKGSDLWFMTVDAPFGPEVFFRNQELILGPQVRPATR